MSRFSLSNRLFEISHKEFLSLTADFKGAVERVWNTPCSLTLDVLRQPLVYTTFFDEEIQDNLNQINQPNVLLKTAEPREVDANLWKLARYVGVMLRPVSEEAAPSFAFANIEFKGRLPRQACFYAQPDNDAVETEMRKIYRSKLVGDGYESNGVRSSATPAYIRSWR